MKTPHVCLAILFPFLLMGGNSWAGEPAEDKTDEKKETPGEFKIPSIPKAPVASALGEASESLPTGTPAEAAAALISVFKDGKLNQGAAFEFTPFWSWWLKGETTLKKWQDNLGTQMLSSLAFSFMTTGNQEGGVTLGGGARMTLYDRLDPRLDKKLQQCMLDAYSEAKKVHPSQPVDPTLTGKEKEVAEKAEAEADKKQKEFVDKAHKACREAHKKRVVDGTISGDAFALAIVATGQSKTAELDELEFGQFHAWFSGSYHFGGIASSDWGLSILGGGHYVLDDTKNVHNLNVALSLALEFKRFSLSARAAWSPEFPLLSDGGDKVLERAVVGGEFKFMISDSVGLGLVYGRTFAEDKEKRAQTLTVNLILGTSNTGINLPVK